jgi:hypothetical protein
MHSFGKGFAFLTHYIKNLRGGSQPILAHATDGHTYVVKFANNLQGPNILFNESAGSELYVALGLPVPIWRPLRVSEDFLEKNPDCWIQTPEGRLRPSSGLCFGSRFLGDNGRRHLEILPRTSFERVRNPTDFWLAWLIDVCAEHADNRQALFAEDAKGWLHTYFVDFGHFFGGPKADLKKHFRVSRYLDSRIYGQVSSEALVAFRNIMRALDTGTLYSRIEAIPAEWHHASAVAGFERCLDRLANSVLVQSILETLANDIERKPESGYQGNEQGPGEILCLGVQGTKRGRNFAYHSLGA